jgi:TPP-dependent indolepyruvate ferredoxin oxidoreductase alpha subunit
LTTGTLVSGYPGSPLGTLDLEVQLQQALMTEHDIFFVAGYRPRQTSNRPRLN